MRHLPRLVLPALSTSADHWEPLRRPARHNDEALTGTTRAWLRKLPASRRPQQLCIQFPRIANLLAWHWRDPVQVRRAYVNRTQAKSGRVRLLRVLLPQTDATGCRCV